MIRSSGIDLLKLLNDILDLAKVESNTIHFEISELPLIGLRDSMLKTFQPVADDQGLAFSVDIDERLPRAMLTDPDRLRQVMANLVSNAFKFTAHGAVAVTMELSANGWSSGHERLARADSAIALRVTDTGIGIKAELQSEMFEAFAQADGTTARQYGGTGLGLSISRNLVSLLGGEITVTSEPGTGSTFTVYLPLETAAAEAADARHPAAAPMLLPLRDGAGHEWGSAAGATVLVVDDDFRNVFALTALLERAELIAVAAQSGAEALEHPRATLRDRARVDGHHDAAHERLRDDDCHSPTSSVRRPSDHRRHGQGDRRRARALSRGRRVRLHLQTGRYSGALDGSAQMAPGQGQAGRAGMSTDVLLDTPAAGASSTPTPAAAILVVDDDGGTRIAIRSILESLGHTIVDARSGEDALREVLEQTFAVILMDVQMPEMDGYETARLIRLRRESERTPIIFLTAYACDELEIPLAYTTGAVDFIFAPIVPDILRAKVSIFVDLFVKTRDLEQSLSEVTKLSDQFRASEERFRLIAENAQDLIALLDAEGRYVYLSPSCDRVLGYANGALVGTVASELIHPDDWRDGWTWGAAPLREMRLLKADGHWLWVEGLSYAITGQRRIAIRGDYARHQSAKAPRGGETGTRG